MSRIRMLFPTRIPAPCPPSIPPEQWRVLRLHVNEGLSTNQIAKHLGLKRSTVEKRLNTAAARYQTLRSQMAPPRRVMHRTEVTA